MNNGTIFTVDEAGNLMRMSPSAPANEDHMQMLVAKYPELIGDKDGELLLIRREQPISDALDVSGRWSLDHLFVTRAGIPVLVELKRASDTRIRREVVGQLLDYAANGVAYWQAGKISEAFNATCSATGIDPETRLLEFLGEDATAAFWDQVDANFQAGRIKLVFVADVIPRELARVVEFLNDQMKADVRAVELRWFTGEGNVTTLVPRIIGETERAASQKTSGHTISTLSRDEWIGEYIAPRGNSAMAGVRAFVTLVEHLGGEANPVKTQGSIAARFSLYDGAAVSLLYVLREGTVSLNLGNLSNCPALDQITKQKFYDELTDILGPLKGSNLQGFPSFTLDKLSDPALAKRFEDFTGRLIDVARLAAPTTP